MKITPKDILLYTGSALIAYLLFKGVRSQTNSFERETEKQEKKAIENQTKEDIQRSAKEFMLSWRNSKTGKIETTNLDTLAAYLKAAMRGSFWGEDEEQIKKVMFSIPISVKSKRGITYPIRTIAVRYSVQTGGKDLKSDLVKYLSSRELDNLGVTKHLKYL